ncbi:response regulator [Lichenifustis flavocetrariae]|uniref:response regulator n=1 Tax=Lichenifustis flavocetrariae TaxID=2949735 RepID=UPI003D138E74
MERAVEEQSKRRVVLVVDDEPSLCLLAAELFTEAGCEVVSASSGTEALATLEERSDVSLLFTDCRMPLMSGTDLARTASERWPNLRIVLSTGFQDRLLPEWPMVWKPYSVRTIERVVDRTFA